MNDTASWQMMDRSHHLHPFTDHADLARRGSRIIIAAEGCWLVDSEGRRILDGMAGLWCVNVGYGQMELVEAARDQMARLPYYNSFFQCTTPAAVELAAKLAEIAPGRQNHVFFASSGSEANDTAIKLIRYFWNLEGKPDKKIIIARHYAYHGVTLATASLSGLSPMHPQADLPLPGFEHVDAPYWFAHGGEMSPEEFGQRVAAALEERILRLGPDKIAAFVGEPIQGAGGVIIPPPGYWQEIQRICRRHDILLVADEVICGFGRTGNWWGSTTFGIDPDIVTTAKGLSSGYVPIAAVLVGERVARTLIDSGEEWSHGFTYSGHPVAAAVALKNIMVLEREGLDHRASGPIGTYFQEALATLLELPLVGEVRTKGLIAAIELVQNRKSRRCFPGERAVGLICRNHAIDAGLVMRAVRDVMVLAPPLIITEAEIDTMVERAALAIRRTAADL